MNESQFTKIRPCASDYCQPTTMLEIGDPCLMIEEGHPILYGTLLQNDAAKASYGTDTGFFCYVGEEDLTRWAGPYLLCDNPTDAKVLSSPKPIRVGSKVILVGKYEAEGRNGIIVYQSDSPLEKFRFVSSFRISVDCVPDTHEDGRMYLYSTQDGDLTLREFSSDLLHLSAPVKLTEKLKATAAPCPIKDTDGKTVGLIVPTEKGLMFLTKPQKEGAKWKPNKLKWKLPADSISSFRDDTGRDLLVIGLNHSFALIPYTLKKSKLSLGDAILPYREDEIRTVQEAHVASEQESGEESQKKGKKEITLPISLSTLAAITIALVSAGIGIMMGLSTGKEKKEKPQKVKKEKRTK